MHMSDTHQNRICGYIQNEDQKLEMICYDQFRVRDLTNGMIKPVIGRPDIFSDDKIGQRGENLNFLPFPEELSNCREPSMIQVQGISNRPAH